MKINSLTKASKHYNEDAIIVKDPLYIVIDGATPLYTNNIYPNSSIASELVNFFVNTLLHSFTSNDCFINTVNNISRLAYNHFQFKTNVPAKLPSLGLAAVIDKGNFLELYLLGDCAISIEYKNNNLYRFIDTKLNKLDSEVILEIAKGKTRDEVLPLLINNRNLLGVKYQAFIPSENPNFTFLKKKIRKDNLKKLLIYSDGYYSARSTFGIVKNHQEFIKANIFDLSDKIGEVAENDIKMEKYPRFKIVDDISVIEIIFDN